jgi:carboxymethylenebutenolidase
MAMSRYEIEATTVRVPHHTLRINAYLAQPKVKGHFPAVIVFQEIFGVNAHIRDVVERIAKEGYVAIAPALYQRFAPGFEAGYSAEDIEIGREYKARTTVPNLLGDTQAVIAYLRQLSNVKLEAIGTIGFCFGGHVAYLVATLPEIKATASFYGAGITSMTPGGGAPTVSRTAEIQGVLYAFFGSDDASIPLAEVEQIKTELTAHKVRHQVFIYPAAGHGFFCDRRESYRPQAATESWQEVLQLFQTQLQKTQLQIES